MLEFEHMWEEYITWIGITKHHFKLTSPDFRFITSAPYCAGPKLGELEKIEVYKTIRMNVIDIATLEWSSPIVFPPK